jgi:hypothetical protein
MLQKLFLQFKVFSRENWWIYLIFLVSFSIILYTWKGNLYEVIGIFFLNVLGNIYMLLMQDSFKDSRFKTGVVFLFLWNILYFLLAIYSYFINWELQYLLWQIWFQLAWIKTFMFFYWNRDIRFLNFTFMVILSAILVYIWAIYLNISGYQFIQSVGFAFTVIGMSAISDMNRYILIFIWIIITTIWSILGLYINYLNGSIFWITISFAILSLSSSIFYVKLLPLYISRFKNT